MTTTDYTYGYAKGLEDLADFKQWAMNATGSSDTSKMKISVDSAAGIVRVGKYEIHINNEANGTVEIIDTTTGKSVKAWGDPHVITSDGDRAQFHDDALTIELPEGIKITLTPTNLDNQAGGFELIQSVSIMTPLEAIEIDNVNQNPTFGEVLRGRSDEVDKKHADGTVMYVDAGGELDDLRFRANGNELVGEDPSATFNEHQIDGMGGVSKFDFEKLYSEWKKAWCDSVYKLEETDFAGMDIFTILFMLTAKVQEDERRVVEHLASLQNTKSGYELARSKVESGEDPEAIENFKTANGFNDEFLEDLSGNITKATSDVQQLEQYRQQLNTMVSQLLSGDHNAKMQILRNLPAQ